MATTEAAVFVQLSASAGARGKSVEAETLRRDLVEGLEGCCFLLGPSSAGKDWWPTLEASWACEGRETDSEEDFACGIIASRVESDVGYEADADPLCYMRDSLGGDSDDAVDRLPPLNWEGTPTSRGAPRAAGRGLRRRLSARERGFRGGEQRQDRGRFPMLHLRLPGRGLAGISGGDAGCAPPCSRRTRSSFSRDGGDALSGDSGSDADSAQEVLKEWVRRLRACVGTEGWRSEDGIVRTPDAPEEDKEKSGTLEAEETWVDVLVDMLLVAWFRSGL